MKAKYSFEFMDLEDGLVAVPVGEGAQQFHGVLKVNETAAAILKLLADDITEQEITDALLKEYKGERKQVGLYVHQFVEKMVSEGIVE